MGQTKEGAKKYRETMIAKHGSLEAYQEWRKNISINGGKKGHNGGFASDKVGKDGLTGKQRSIILAKTRRNKWKKTLTR